MCSAFNKKKVINFTSFASVSGQITPGIIAPIVLYLYVGSNYFMFAIGFDTEGLPSAVWPGGETEALTRIERHLERKVQACV